MWYFVWFVSSTQIEIFPQMEINDRKSLENFLKNIYGGVCFNKIASLCSTKSNSTITRLHYRLFAEYVQKNCISSSTTEVSPRGFWERELFIKFGKSSCKMSVSFLIEQSCRPTIYRLQFYWKGNVWQKHIELTFRGDYYYPKDNLYIFECQFRDANAEISKSFQAYLKIKISKMILYVENE